MNMKRSLALLSGLLLMGGVSVASADESAQARTIVQVHVNPNIALVPLAPHVDLGTVQTGNFGGNIMFRVDANSQKVFFSAAASKLFKGDDPESQFSIPLDIDHGIVVEATNASPLDKISRLKFVDEGPEVCIGEKLIKCFKTLETEVKGYESGTNGTFSQDVLVEVHWNQGDNELPQGEYSGVVKLMAMLSPDA